MTNYAYLRVSTDRQDVDNQRHGLLEYANSHKLVHRVINILDYYTIRGLPI
jgi:DNA invertase Pin-like site-specific DNA recombinase